MMPPFAQTQGVRHSKWSTGPFRSPDGEPVPHFRNDAEAQRHAALTRPFENAHGALEEGYAARYGARAAFAAANCRSAALRGDTQALQIHQHALSLVLFADQPQLFESKRRAA
jgi:hypothetical protein